MHLAMSSAGQECRRSAISVGTAHPATAGAAKRLCAELGSVTSKGYSSNHGS